MDPVLEIGGAGDSPTPVSESPDDTASGQLCSAKILLRARKWFRLLLLPQRRRVGVRRPLFFHFPSLRLHCHLVKSLIKNCMYIVFTICFQAGDAKPFDLSTRPLAASHRTNSRPDVLRRFLRASSGPRGGLYSPAAFVVPYCPAFVASENH